MAPKIATIFIDPNADVSDVIYEISAAKANQLILVFPSQALVMQNLINLQIIRSILPDLGKQVEIATSDPLAQKLVQLAELPLHLPGQPTGDGDKIVTIKSTDSPESAALSSPEIRHTTPWVNFRKKSLRSEPEIVEPEPTPSKPTFSLGLPQYSVPRFQLPKIEFAKYSSAQIKLVGALSAIGLVLLGTVSLFVIPKAYVAIEVQSEPYTEQFTLTLADEQDSQAVGPNILAGRFIETTREQVATFKASGEVNKGAGSSGQINAVNYTNGIQGILANTKFVSDAGLVFKIKSDVLVPPARGNTPGRAVVEAVSEGGGAKYNVSSPLKLTIPNLSAGLKPLLYGEVVGSFSGGTDDIVKAVSQEDLDHAKEEAAKNIFVSAGTDLARQATRKEEINENFIQNDIIDAVPSVTAGAEEDEFEVRVQSRSWTILIPKGSFAASVANAANFEVDPTKQVTDATLAAATVEPVESNFITHQINLVVSLNGRLGPRLDRAAIQKSIMGKSKSAAQSYLQGLENITTTSLDIWPTFLSKVPVIVQNIKIRVIYLGE